MYLIYTARWLCIDPQSKCVMEYAQIVCMSPSTSMFYLSFFYFVLILHHFVFISYDLHQCSKRMILIFDALQQNREQVAQGYFEIWTIEVGIGVKNNSSVDFEMFAFFLHTLMCFLSPPCNFWLIFKHFPTKRKSAFAVACHIQNYRNRKLLKSWFLKITLPEKPFTIYKQVVISQKIGEVWTWFWYQIKAVDVLLTMIPKTHFTQNIACSLFCGSASHLIFMKCMNDW